MQQPHDQESRRRTLERLFFERGWEQVEEAGNWDGQEVEDLRGALTEEQFEALVDALQEQGEYEQ